MSGRTAVVTGANSGIGLAAARALAAGGWRVVLAVRDTAKGERAAAGIEGETEVRPLDLADLASVRAFAEAWGSEPLDVLVNNAGVMALPHSRTADGFEMQIGTNHLGHFALTNLLLGHVTDRVVTVASGAHRIPGGLDLDDLNWERRRYDRWRAYGQSKLQHLVMKVGNLTWAQSEKDGARPTVYAVTEDLPGNSYVGPNGFQEMRGRPTLVGRSRAASDEDRARGLWKLSERLTDTIFPLEPVLEATGG
jgi:nucleoside-diphosphate-sugar epimerase